MTTEPIGAARRRARGAILGSILALVSMVALGACGGIIGSFVSTRDALSAAGYSKVSVGIAGDNNLVVSATVDQDTSAGEIREIAAIVWRDFHQRFGALEITLHGANATVRQVLPFSELQRQIGSRNPADNKTSIRAGVLRAGIVVLGVAVLVVAAVIVVAVVLVRRRRRGRQLRAGPLPPGDGPLSPGGGWPAAGGGPGPGAPWGAPVPAPAATPGAAPIATPGPPSPWEPPPGSGPPAWS